MRALYFTLCIVAVTTLPPRQYKKFNERKLELTTEAKIETKEKPVEETKEPADKKDNITDNITDKEAPRAYYENQSVNVVSTTSTTITDQEKLMPQVSYAPQVDIGRPQVNLAQNVKQYIPSRLQNKPKKDKDDDKDDKKNVYTVNVYVNFPNDDEEYEHHHNEYDDEDEECRKGKCWAKAKCKEGQVSVKGVCADRT